jgi:hypothetical protein
MISKNVLLILLCLLPQALMAKGGGWISSGGESFLDGKNPWFLHGTSIQVCLAVDSGMSLPASEIKPVLDRAIKYWQEEFKKETDHLYAPSRRGFKLGENTFVFNQELGCSGDEDLRFLFGSESLTERERLYLQTGLKNYVGVAVRTDYDRTHLRGKGFIYIASDKDLQNAKMSEDLIAKPWSHAKLLEMALIHEIGHVFGIPHMGGSIMSEIFMDLLLSRYFYQDFIDNGAESFISSERELRFCSLLPTGTLNFFGIPLNTACLIGVWKDSKTFELYSQQHREEPVLVARALGLTMELVGIRSRPIAYLRVTGEQQVFSPEDLNHRSLLPGPLQERFNLRGRLLLMKSLQVHPVMIEVSPESVLMHTTSQDQFLTVFSFDSPLSKILGQTVELQ